MNLLCLIGLHKVTTTPRRHALEPWLEKCERCGLHTQLRKIFKTPATPEEREYLRKAGIPWDQIP